MKFLQKMIHFFRRKWPYLKKGSIVVGISSLVIVALGMNVVLISNKKAVWQSIRLKTAQTEFTLRVSLAKTTREQALGLMGAKSLSDGEGMLFVFGQSKLASFWMKNMKIPLDIVFIGEDQKIKHVAEKAPPCPLQGFCPQYASPVPVRYVLEVPSGYMARNQIKPGDDLFFQ